MNAEGVGQLTAPKVSIVAAVVASLVFLVAAAMVLVSLARWIVVPLLSQGQLPEGWTAGSALVLFVSSLAVLGLFGASLYRRLNTQLGWEGLTFPTLRGPAQVPWSAVERVSGKGMQIKLHTARTVVTINALCYARPAGVAAFVLARLPPGARNAS